MSLEFSERMRRIPQYPAAETYEYGGELVKLASNETAWSPHPAVIEAVERQLQSLNRYPDPDRTLLRTRLAERLETTPAPVAGGNGPPGPPPAAREAPLRAPAAPGVAPSPPPRYP